MPRSLSDLAAPGQELLHFTNREQERDVLRRVMSLPVGRPLPVVAFYGVGGTGKSWLLRKLREELRDVVPTALLDLEPQSGGTAYHTDGARALVYLRTQFSASCPRFDLAYAWLRHKEGATDEPALKMQGPLNEALEIIGEVSSIAEMIPGVGWLWKKISSAAKKRFAGSALEKWLAEKTGEEDFLRLRRYSAQDIYPQLSNRLLLDLRERLPPREGNACRGIIFLDTFEALRQGSPSGSQAHHREAWVRELHAVDSPVLLVIAGRDRLRWQECDADYREERFLEQHLVGGLSENDARLFLARCGIAELALQDAVLRVAADQESTTGQGYPGAHPFSLGLCADTIQSEQLRGQEIQPSAFDLLPGDTTRLAQRFLRSLGDPAHELWVRRLALTPRFDEAAARAAYSLVPGAAQDVAWQTLLRYSFVRESDAPGWFTLHTRMRDALAETGGDEVREVHAYWQSWWNSRSNSETDACAGLAWFHHYCLDAEAAFKRWEDQQKTLSKAARTAEHLALLDWWEPTGVLSDPAPSMTTARHLSRYATELRSTSLGRQEDNVRNAIELLERALSVLEEESAPHDWALATIRMGASWFHLPTKKPIETYARAQQCFEASLRILTKEAYPDDWAYVQYCLGRLCMHRLTGNPAENLREAEQYYQNALTVFHENSHPNDWAWVQYLQSTVRLSYHLPGDASANRSSAINLIQNALRVYTEKDDPSFWATAMSQLGNAYQISTSAEIPDHLEKSIECYLSAQRVDSEDRNPTAWAHIENSLAVTMTYLKSGDRLTNLQKAVEHYRNALRVLTEEDNPQSFATTKNLLAIAYREIALLNSTKDAAPIASEIKDVLRVATEVDSPLVWASAQWNLGDAYLDSSSAEQAEHYRQAIDAYQSAARVHTEENFPSSWASLQQKTALAYHNNPTGDKAENLDKAIFHYELALRVHTESAYPSDWGVLQNNLGRAYLHHPGGDRQENLRRGRDHFLQCERIWTEVDNPLGWAGNQSNLGETYSQLQGSERVTYLRQAIEHYQNALRVWTETTYPADWARTTVELGRCFTKRPNCESDADIEIGLKCFTASLRFYSEEVRPKEWAVVQFLMGLAHFSRNQIDLDDRQSQSTACYHAALRHLVAKEFFPVWGQCHFNLGQNALYRRAGDRRENLRLAESHYRSALEEFDPARAPAERAEVNLQLARTLLAIQGENRQTNLREAIACLQSTENVFSLEHKPDQWVNVQDVLALVWLQLDGDREQNLQSARECYRNIQRHCTREAKRLVWARAQFLLGESYILPPTETSRERLQSAMDAFEPCIDIYSEAETPREWGQLMVKVGYLCLNLAEDTAVERLRQAGIYLEGALRVTSESDNPGLWAPAHFNLGFVHAKLAAVLDAPEDRISAERALAHCEAASRGFRIVGAKGDAETAENCARAIRDELEAADRAGG